MALENLLKNFGVQPDPYGTPFPSLPELALRSLPGFLPPRGQLPNNFLGGATRLGGTLGGILGEEMAARRRDPMGRLIPMAGEVFSALDQAQVPTGEILNAPPLIQPQPPIAFPGRITEQTVTGGQGGPPPTPLGNLTFEAPKPEMRPARGFAERFGTLSPEKLRKAMFVERQGIPLAPKFPTPEEFSLGQGQARYRALPGGGVEQIAQGPPQEPHIKTFRRNVSPTQDAEFTIAIDRQGTPIGEAREIPGTRARLTEQYDEVWLPTGKQNEEALYRVNKRTGEREPVPGIPARPRRERSELDELGEMVKRQQADIGRINSIRGQIATSRQELEKLTFGPPGETKEGAQSRERQRATQTQRLELLNESLASGGMATDDTLRKAVGLYGKDKGRLTRALKALGFTTFPDGSPIP